ncbi:MAG: transcriptional regulator [Gammaproteobacteria bacterium]|nr:transcriptional regulator [Gammaproteobacteria bacterium]
MNNENQIFLKELGILIKKNRMKLGKSKAFLADYLGESVGFINDIEQGKRELSLLNISKLGNLYNLDLIAKVSTVIAKKKEKPKSMISFSSVLGSLISIKRKEQGISQEQLARKIQLTRLTLSKIESGDTNISAQKLAYLDTIFETDLMREARDNIKKLKEQQSVDVFFDEDKDKPEKKKDNTAKYIAGASAIAVLFALLR